MTERRRPESRREETRETLHGVVVDDPYRWLEDAHSPETRAWIEAQNEYTESLIGDLPDRDGIQSRLESLMQVDSVGMPTVRAGRYFYMRRRSHEDLYGIVMRDGLRGEETVLVDPGPMSPDHTTSVDLWDVSEDGRLLIYGIREGGADETSLHLLDVDSRQDRPDVLPTARYFNVSLTSDTAGFYYTRHTDEGPRALYHALGHSSAEDVTLFGDGLGPEKILLSELSDDGSTLVLTVCHGSAGRQEIYFHDVSEGPGVLPVVTLVNDLDARFTARAIGHWIFLQTDWEAPRGRILRVEMGSPERTHWLEIVPQGQDILDGFSLIGERLYTHGLRHAASMIQERLPDGQFVAELELPDIGSAGLSGRWSDSEAFLGFTSFHTPYTIYHLDVDTGEQEVWAAPEVPVDLSSLETHQYHAVSRDGTLIPVFLVHRAGLERDGRRPVLLTGYGGFNASLTPAFSARAACWALGGGVFAVANLRGGGEFGEEWHRAGMLEQKQNVFDDFLAAAEWLIAEQYTSSDRLAIAGGSNGGLLVGAALTQRPDLFRAVVCSYPLLDMLRYHLFLVARFWVPEYGSSDDPALFPVIHAYSPYHRVKRGERYPAVLLITGDADTRVDPLHARKMTAILQWASGSHLPVLLHYDTQAGHSGGRPLGKQISDLADELSFLFWQLGVDWADPRSEAVIPRA